MPSEKQIEAAQKVFLDARPYMGSRELATLMLTAAEQAEPAPGADEEEEVAKLIWERFAPAHEVEWPSGNAGEYRQVAKDIVGKFRP